MLPDPNDFFQKRPDGVWENELAETLLSHPEDDRRRFLEEVVKRCEAAKRNPRIWFKIANSVLENRDSIRAVFLAGLQKSDASSIRAWLEFAVTRLGCRRVLDTLAKAESHEPKVALTFYWLPAVTRTAAELELVRDFLAKRRAD